MIVWYTSDLHFGHANILGFADRPWDTLDEMHRGLIERWNYHVSYEDTVYILGDLVMGNREENLKFVERLAGNKILLPGNHDHCFPGGKKTWRDWVSMYESAGLTILEMIPPVLSLPAPLDGIDAHMAHFPRIGDSREDPRYSAWRTGWDGWLLHGHTHARGRIDHDRLQVHVGVDAWDWSPVASEQLVSLIQAG